MAITMNMPISMTRRMKVAVINAVEGSLIASMATMIITTTTPMTARMMHRTLAATMSTTMTMMVIMVMMMVMTSRRETSNSQLHHRYKNSTLVPSMPATSHIPLKAFEFDNDMVRLVCEGKEYENTASTSSVLQRDCKQQLVRMHKPS